jgi:hypothetical protein
MGRGATASALVLILAGLAIVFRTARGQLVPRVRGVVGKAV